MLGIDGMILITRTIKNNKIFRCTTIIVVLNNWYVCTEIVSDLIWKEKANYIQILCKTVT